MTTLRTSAAGRKAIAAREGNKLTAYLDSVGILTIGVGHTTAAGPPTVTKGMKITAAQSDEILTRDLAGVEADINRLVKVPLNQAQFDALVSLVFNIGGTAFGKSTLLKKLNARDYAGAADQFLVWNKGTIGGKRVALAGLTTRRKAERVQFLSEGAKASPAAPVVAPDLYDGKPHIEVENVQKRLDELLYPEVGTIDGKWGSKTAAAILAFRNDNGLPTDAKIDTALLTALMTAKPREIAPARANATVADLRKEDAPEIKQTDQTKIGGYGLAALGAFTGGQQALNSLKDTSSTVRTIWDTLEPLQALVMDNIWLILAAGGAFFVYKSGVLQNIRLFKHQTGQDVSA